MYPSLFEYNQQSLKRSKSIHTVANSVGSLFRIEVDGIEVSSSGISAIALFNHLIDGESGVVVDDEVDALGESIAEKARFFGVLDLGDSARCFLGLVGVDLETSWSSSSASLASSLCPLDSVKKLVIVVVIAPPFIQN
jgi:hypothetical protein